MMILKIILVLILPIDSKLFAKSEDFNVIVNTYHFLTLFPISFPILKAYLSKNGYVEDFGAPKKNTNQALGKFQPFVDLNKGREVAFQRMIM